MLFTHTDFFLTLALYKLYLLMESSVSMAQIVRDRALLALCACAMIGCVSRCKLIVSTVIPMSGNTGSLLAAGEGGRCFPVLCWLFDVIRCQHICLSTQNF